MPFPLLILHRAAGAKFFLDLNLIQDSVFCISGYILLRSLHLWLIIPVFPNPMGCITRVLKVVSLQYVFFSRLWAFVYSHRWTRMACLGLIWAFNIRLSTWQNWVTVWACILNVMGYIGDSFLEWEFSNLYVEACEDCGKVQIPETHPIDV